MKICIKCKEVKLFSYFSKDKSQKDGYQNTCKKCRKLYYENNKEKISIQSKNYREINKDSIAEYDRERYKLNRIKRINKVKQYYEINKHKLLTQMKDYAESNKCKLKDYFREYYEANKDKFKSYVAKRRAIKLKATPNWLTIDDFIEIEELYTCAQMFKLYTGQDYHVDHIVPLQGKNVCGLHVPWNLQVITAKENLSKHNKLLD